MEERLANKQEEVQMTRNEVVNLREQLQSISEEMKVLKNNTKTEVALAHSLDLEKTCHFSYFQTVVMLLLLLCRCTTSSIAWSARRRSDRKCRKR